MLESLPRVEPRRKRATLFEYLVEVTLYPVGRCKITELTPVKDDRRHGTAALRTPALTVLVYVALRDVTVLGTVVCEHSPVSSERVIRGFIWSGNRGLVVDARTVARGAQDGRAEFRLFVPAVGTVPVERGQSPGEWLGGRATPSGRNEVNSRRQVGGSNHPVRSR